MPFNVNGYKFWTLTQENGLKTHNSRAFMTSITNCVSSHQNVNADDADLPYYVKLVDIIQLNYYGNLWTSLNVCGLTPLRIKGL